MSQRIITGLSLLAVFVSLPLLAEEQQHDDPASSPGLSRGSMHESMHESKPGPAMVHVADQAIAAERPQGGQVSEGGQSAFSALIEMVAILESDPDTDWEKVDIDSLHAHLLDMNRVILDTRASSTLIDQRNIRFDIVGTATSLASIYRMVSAHSYFVQQSRGWSIDTELHDTGAVVTIGVDDETDLQRLKALGFYGFMSLESHHQAHHYQMAIGNSHQAGQVTGNR